MTTFTPEVMWAQRSNEHEPEKNVIYLTINAIDVSKPSITLTPTSLVYDGKSASGKEYAVTLDFFDEIDVDNSKYTTTDRDSFFVLRKKEAKEEFWPRLLKDKRKVHYLKTDFDKWVDEDEQETAPPDDLSQFGGMGGMPGMGDMGGMGGLDFSALQSQLGGSFDPSSAGPSSFGLGDNSDDEEEEGEEGAEPVPELVEDKEEEVA
ncbi:protein wos2 [Limtongia smithiae]|uniref:protein wos2 n=1 Tax=Limtongia smithiae TaxID=1125753 RepID=UPI0034CFE39A